jgi:hypothetical protein
MHQPVQVSHNHAASVVSHHSYWYTVGVNLTYDNDIYTVPRFLFLNATCITNPFSSVNKRKDIENKQIWLEMDHIVQRDAISQKTHFYTKRTVHIYNI